MVSESSAWLHFVWSCSWRVWSCRSWSWSSLSITALSAFASVSSERRSNSWAYKGAVHKRVADEGIQRQIHMLSQTPDCTCFQRYRGKKVSNYNCIKFDKQGSVSVSFTAFLLFQLQVCRLLWFQWQYQFLLQSAPVQGFFIIYSHLRFALLSE